MYKRIGIALAATMMAWTPAMAGQNEITVGALASEWSSDTALTPPSIFPVGGAGQLNGEFVIAERDGAQIGLRVTDRTDGLLPVSGKNTGLYLACTGEEAENRAEWNYDIHLDLRGTDTTLSDYEFTLTQTFADSLYGATGPRDLSFAEISGIYENAQLLQFSWNPYFGNDSFSAYEEDTYNLVLKLKPRAGGTPLIAHARVEVVDCE